MKFSPRAKVVAPCLLAAATLALSFSPAAARSAKATPLYLVAYTAFHPTGFTRNFNPYNANAMDFTVGAMYEPLMIITPASGGHSYPWLATGYKISNGGKTITVTLRAGLKWSDGKPLTAADVAFTFNYGKKYPAADQNGLWAAKLLQSVTASGPTTVVFKLNTADSTLLPNILTNMFVIPQHAWSQVTDPAGYANSNPVGSGPFTQVTSFSSQEMIYTKNPYYWQPLAYDGIKVPLFIDNNGADVARAKGELDWTGNFVADIQRVYVGKDPAHFRYYFAQTNPLGIWFNNTRYPYSLAGFRKALSLAIDRKKLSAFAENGYELPVDATGINNTFPTWEDPSLKAQAVAETTYDPARAKSMLTSLGFTYKNNDLYDPHGKLVSFTMVVPTGWSDWILQLQVLAQEFKAIGINASYKTLDPATWTTKSGMGQLDAQLHWTGYSVNPYYTYYSYMSKESFTPLGQDVNLTGQNNWERYFSPQATSLFAQFRATQDTQTQKQLMYKVEKIQVDEMPMIPTVSSADWYEYSTKNFTGWPTQQNFYIQGTPNNTHTRVMVLTRLKPVK